MDKLQVSKMIAALGDETALATLITVGYTPVAAAEEIAARSIGASAVLNDDADDELFRKTVANVCGLESASSIKSISSVRRKKRWYSRANAVK